jgi:16S rRNA (cytosine1402-N4)-methyltransferase
MSTGHYPVMLEEAVEALALSGGDTIVDATFGGGGHTRRILRELGPEGKVIGIDLDPEAAGRALRLAEEDSRFTFRPGAYDEVLADLVEEGAKADAVLFDLGLSSYQIDEAGRGFSYVREGPLDMRMNPGRGESAADFLNAAGTAKIAEVLVRYGDVPRGEARRVATEIVRRRPLRTTLELSEAVRSAVGWKERGGNPAKRVFQAVRVYVNDELGSLERALGVVERLLVPGGRLVAITFHSGEDRVVKRFISERTGRCVCPPELPVCVCGARPIFRKGVVRKPSAREIEENPRSASARLRSAVRTSEPPELPEETS